MLLHARRLAKNTASIKLQLWVTSNYEGSQLSPGFFDLFVPWLMQFPSPHFLHLFCKFTVCRQVAIAQGTGIAIIFSFLKLKFELMFFESWRSGVTKRSSYWKERTVPLKSACKSCVRAEVSYGANRSLRPTLWAICRESKKSFRFSWEIEGVEVELIESAEGRPKMLRIYES